MERIIDNPAGLNAVLILLGYATALAIGGAVIVSLACVRAASRAISRIPDDCRPGRGRIHSSRKGD